MTIPTQIASKRYRLNSTRLSSSPINLFAVLEYFIRELKVLRKVSHPHVVKFIGFVEDFANGKAWIVFPWESHGNVREFLKTGHWEIPERISLVRTIYLISRPSRLTRLPLM